MRAHALLSSQSPASTRRPAVLDPYIPCTCVERHIRHTGARAKPHPPLFRVKTHTAPLDSDGDDDGGGGQAGSDGGGGGGAMEDAGPPADIEDLSIHSFDGHTVMRERRVTTGGPPPPGW